MGRSPQNHLYGSQKIGIDRNDKSAWIRKPCAFVMVRENGWVPSAIGNLSLCFGRLLPTALFVNADAFPES